MVGIGGGGGLFGGRDNRLCCLWYSVGLGVRGLWVSMFDTPQNYVFVYLLRGMWRAECVSLLMVWYHCLRRMVENNARKKCGYLILISL